MTAAPDHRDSYRQARFEATDFAGARFRDCDLRGARLASCWFVDVSLSGVVDRLVVNDVDVTAFVEAELDRRHPERVQCRDARTADELRAMWDTVEQMWSATVERARRLPEAMVHERVDDEWSFTETLRHLALATDLWVGRGVLGDPMPFDRLDLPPTDYPPEAVAALGVDLAAEPSLDEVVALRADRLAVVRGVLAGLVDDDLELVGALSPDPAFPDEHPTVRSCLRVVMREECDHHRFATRDLAVLESR
jgi:DinB superfamily/Pentapeptide repeats (8 copies)